MKVRKVLAECTDGTEKSRPERYPYRLRGRSERLPEAINAVYPEMQIQLCIVHMVRNSLRFVAWKDYKAVTRDLKQVYRAATEEARCRRWMRSGRNGMHDTRR